MGDFKGKEYVIAHSPDQLQGMLDPDIFFKDKSWVHYKYWFDCHDVQLFVLKNQTDNK